MDLTIFAFFFLFRKFLYLFMSQSKSFSSLVSSQCHFHVVYLCHANSHYSSTYSCSQNDKLFAIHYYFHPLFRYTIIKSFLSFKIKGEWKWNCGEGRQQNYHINNNKRGIKELIEIRKLLWGELERL